MRAVVLIALVFAAGCNAGAPKAPATYTPAQAGTTAAPWLDPQAQVATAVRLVTPAGVDLRQAVYLRQGQAVRIVALTRDYSQRAEGVSDPQSLQLLQAGPGEPQALDTGPDYLPLKLFAAPSRTAFCLAAVKRGAGVKLADAALVQLAYGKDGAFKVLDQQPGIAPLGYVSEQLLFCRGVTQRERAGGLVILGLDWGGGAQVCDLAHGTFHPTNGVSFVSSADNSHIAGYQLHYDPALPAQAQIEYVCTGKRRQNARWILPYHVSYETELWQPPLQFIDNATLATIAFRPDTTGRGEKANYNGLFRVVALDAASGNLRIIEDRVMPYASLVAGAGLVFYVLRLRAEAGVTWEVWAASADGLSKQRVWSTSDAEYVALQDLLDGRRLLVHRQYVQTAGPGPELHSELIELSLGTLEQSTGISAAAPAAPAPGEAAPAPPAEAQDLFIPDEPGGGTPGPAPGGEGGNPPPIAVP